jgi:simple sugar transport system permease protein
VVWLRLLKAKLYALFEPAASLAVGLAAASLVLLVAGYEPSASIYVLFSEGFRDPTYLLERATPLVATALAFAIPMLAGLFNIGGEGQLYLGALAAIVVSQVAANPVIVLGVSTLAGASLGALIGLLRVRYGVNEVVSSIMLNWIMYYTVLYLVTNHLYDPSIPHQSLPVPEAGRLPRIAWLPVGFLVAILVSLFAYILVHGTRVGYEIRVTGYSEATARYAGVDPALTALKAMTIGGAFGGLGGGLTVATVVPYIDSTMSGLFGLGFSGIGVALLARLNPLAITLSAVFVSGLVIGGQMVELITGVPPELVDATVGAIIISLALPYAYRMLVYHVKARMVR